MINHKNNTEDFSKYLRSYNINGDNDSIKPHVSNLPYVNFNKTEQVKNQKLAVSIPIFASALDSNRYNFDAERIRDFHVRSAVWCQHCL